MEQLNSQPLQHKKQSAFSPLSEHSNLFNREDVSKSPHIKLSEPLFEEDEEQQHEQSLHLDSHQAEDYYCMTCHQNFNIKISPCSHKKGRIPKYKCDYQDCRRSFNIQSGLQRHRLTHTGVKPYQCDYQQCQQKFNQKSNLNRHKRIHTQQKPFICQKCCKSFTTTTNLKQHVQVHFQDKERRKKYVCEIKGCNKQYLYMCNLKKHKQEHDDPMGDCLGEKKPEYPIFSINVGMCTFKIIYKKSKEHSEVLITYKEIEGSSRYNFDSFAKIIYGIHRQSKKGQQKQDDQHFLQEMESVMEGLLQPSKHSLNICFDMHESLSPVANLLVKSIINILGYNNFKVFTLIIPDYHTFRDIVQNLLFDLQPRE